MLMKDVPARNHMCSEETCVYADVAYTLLGGWCPHVRHQPAALDLVLKWLEAEHAKTSGGKESLFDKVTVEVKRKLLARIRMRCKGPVKATVS
jgi:hypothetical protein